MNCTSFRRHPGVLLLAMMSWIAPFLALDLFSHSVMADAASFVPYWVVGGFAVTGILLLEFLEHRLRIWSQRGLWGKFVVAMSAYSVVIGASLTVTVLLDAFGYVAYFGGDAGGSFGLLYVPSVILFWVVGGVICFLLGFLPGGNARAD